MLSWVSISNLASGHPIGRWDWVLGKNRLQSDSFIPEKGQCVLQSDSQSESFIL
jgi:hypothetical protein